MELNQKPSEGLLMLQKTGTYDVENRLLQRGRLQHAIASGQFMTRHRKHIQQMKSETYHVAKTALFFILGSNATQKDTHIQIKEKIQMWIRVL